jgi:hypothetical protein
MVSMLVDRGMVRAESDDWVAAGEVSDVVIPPTIQALLAARLDYLNREERAILEPASVIGLVFPQPAVENLVPDPLRPSVSAQLGTLDRKQFVHPSPDGDGEVYRFHHLLIRDAAYNSLLKRARAQLHEKFVAWAEPVNRERDREIEFEEILGYHLEQAYRYRTELGPIDEETASVGLKGAMLLANAGRRALARGDVPAAANLLSRAISLLRTQEPLRMALLPELAEAWIDGGEFEAAETVLDEGEQTASEFGVEQLAARVALERVELNIYKSGSAGTEQAVIEAGRAIEVFERNNDEAGLARAWRLVTLVNSTVGRFEDALKAAEEYIKHAALAGDTRLAGRGALAYATMALLGPTPAALIISRANELLDQVRGDRTAEAVITRVLSVAHAMQGSFEVARNLGLRARTMLEELGRSVNAASTSIETARVEMLAGDSRAAEVELRRDYGLLTAMGERYYRSTIAGRLAHALIDQDRYDDAREFVEEARVLSAPDDLEAQVLWRAANARLLATAGHAEEAVEVARDVIERADESSDIDLIAAANLDLAAILDLVHEGAEAMSARERALELYELKGNVAAAARVRELLPQNRVA